MATEKGKLKVYNHYGRHSKATGIGEVSILGKDLTDCVTYLEDQVRGRVTSGISMRLGIGTKDYVAPFQSFPTIDKWHQVEAIIDEELAEWKESPSHRSRHAWQDLNRYIGIENVKGLIISRLKSEAEVLINHNTTIGEPQASMFKEERIKLFQIDEEKDRQREKEAIKQQNLRRLEIAEKIAKKRWYQRKGEKTIRRELLQDYNGRDIEAVIGSDYYNDAVVEMVLADAKKARTYARSLLKGSESAIDKIVDRMAVNRDAAEQIWAEISTMPGV